MATGQLAGGFQLNVLLIDLADFGVASASSLVIGMDILSSGAFPVPPDLALVGAINNFVPATAPGALALLIAGLAGIGVIRRGVQSAL